MRLHAFDETASNELTAETFDERHTYLIEYACGLWFLDHYNANTMLTEQIASSTNVVRLKNIARKHAARLSEDDE